MIETISSLSKSIIDEPENTGYQMRLGDAIKYHVFNELTDDTACIKEAVQICLTGGKVSGSSFINAWNSLLCLDQDLMRLIIPAQECYFDGQILPVSPDDLATVLNDPFLLVGLRYMLVSNVSYERFLSCLRSYFLYARHYDADVFLPFLCALAEQCDLNEYIYAGPPEEQNIISGLERDLKITGDFDATLMAKIALTGCYKGLSELNCADEISAAADRAQNQNFKALVKTQISDPAAVKKSYDEIPILSSIEDNVSSSVAKQYEENPYPRWRHVDIPDIAEDKQQLAKGKTILVAGCATGQEPINMALRYPQARVLGIDLSIASIAYGKHKADELGLKNIDFMQADILDLEKLDRTFDMILCVGVLHHMEDPVAGWRKLLCCLAPDGVMKISLYSELARKAIVQCRKLIEEHGLEPTPQGITAFRQGIMLMDDANPMKKILGAVDFFSMSMCRDLVFHVQEHRFTLPQIKSMLDELDLQMIRMIVPDSKDLAAYKEMFPDDNAIKNLDHLNEYEQQNPDTFRSMYTFWSSRNGDMSGWVD